MKSIRSSLSKSGKTDRLAVLSMKAADDLRFFRSWIESPVKMGAVRPSGAGLARTMASFVRPAAGAPVLELGPGTGAVTQALLQRGVRPKDMKLVEYSGAFCQLLKTRFAGVQVHRGDAYALEEVLEALGLAPQSLQAVVSSLPLLTRPAEDRNALLQAALTALKPGAPFIQFSYGGLPPVRGLPPDIALSKSAWIWRNLPPARVYAYRRTLS